MWCKIQDNMSTAVMQSSVSLQRIHQRKHRGPVAFLCGWLNRCLSPETLQWGWAGWGRKSPPPLEHHLQLHPPPLWELWRAQWQRTSLYMWIMTLQPLCEWYRTSVLFCKKLWNVIMLYDPTFLGNGIISMYPAAKSPKPATTGFKWGLRSQSSDFHSPDHFISRSTLGHYLLSWTKVWREVCNIKPCTWLFF